VGWAVVGSVEPGLIVRYLPDVFLLDFPNKWYQSSWRFQANILGRNEKVEQYIRKKT